MFVDEYSFYSTKPALIEAPSQLIRLGGKALKNFYTPVLFREYVLNEQYIPIMRKTISSGSTAWLKIQSEQIISLLFGIITSQLQRFFGILLFYEIIIIFEKKVEIASATCRQVKAIKTFLFKANYLVSLRIHTHLQELKSPGLGIETELQLWLAIIEHWLPNFCYFDHHYFNDMGWHSVRSTEKVLGQVQNLLRLWIQFCTLNICFLVR